MVSLYYKGGKREQWLLKFSKNNFAAHISLPTEKRTVIKNKEFLLFYVEDRVDKMCSLEI